MSEQTGKTIKISNIPDFSSILGCFTDPEDGYTHLGRLFVRKTACGEAMGATILSREVTVTCPACVAEIEYRSEHPEAAQRDLGIVTHRGE